MPTGPACRRCGVQRYDWCSYFCPACGAHNDDLYRREHRDQATAKSMTRADIVAEYRSAGQRYERKDCLWPSRN